MRRFWDWARTYFWPTITAIQLLDVLALTDRVHGIELIIDWERQRTTMFVKGLAGTASALVLTAVAAAFDGKEITLLAAGLSAGVAACLLLWAATLMFGVHRLGADYADAVGKALAA